MKSKRFASIYFIGILIISIFTGILVPSLTYSVKASGIEPLFSGGSGTASDPYKISKVTELQWMGNSSNLDKHFILVNDINASATKTWNSGAGFVPIGTSSNNFKGSLDGKGYNITGLFINRSGTDLQGLFGYVGTGSVVKNVGLINNNVSGRNYVGGLVGSNYEGTVTNCYTIGTVIGAGKYVGGLVGGNTGTVSICYAIGNVSGTGNYIGGLVGYFHSSIVSNCYAVGNVSGSRDYVGGLVGYNYEGTMSNCYAVGNVSGTGNYVGGLMGCSSDMVSNCYATGNVTGRGYIGGLVGGNYGTMTSCYAAVNVIGSGDNIGGFVGDNDGTVSTCYTFGNVIGSGDNVGGLVGYNHFYSTVSKSYATGNVTGRGYIGGLVGHNYHGTVSYCYATGYVIGTGKNVGGLMGYSDICTVSNCYATGNVNGSGDSVGGLVGNNYKGTVSNSYVTGTVIGAGKYVGGLVGYNYEGTVSTCYTFVNVIGSGDNVGGLVGYNHFYSTVSKSYATGNVTGSGNYVGGLVGSNRGTVSNSYVTGTVIGAGKYVGGLVGENDRGTVTNSYYSINASLINNGHFVTRWGLFINQFNDWYLNGLSLNISNYSSTLFPDGSYYNISSIQGLMDLLGFAENREYRFRLRLDIDLSSIPSFHIPYFASKEFDGGGFTISNLWLNQSYMNGNLGMFGEIRTESTVLNLKLMNINITGLDFIGGLVGYNSGTITNCSAAGRMSGRSGVGGLVGENDRGTVTNCYATGSVNGSRDWVGGLVGCNDVGTVTNCYATGSVSGSWDRVGGLVGCNDVGTVTNCYATGKVSGGFGVGGLVGYNSGTVNNGFWDINTTGQISSSGGTGKNTNEIMKKSTFIDAGWDIIHVRDHVDEVWYIDDGCDYPRLGWEYYRDIHSPVAIAGPDKTVNMGETVLLNGSMSTDNIRIVNYTWTLTDGVPIIISGMLQLYRFDNAGIFVVTLNVTDAAGNWDTETMIVIVLDTQIPLANVGPDQILNMGESLHFNASLSTDNVGIISYRWSFTDSVQIILTGINPLYQFDNAGIFVVTLNITDESGNWAIDTMTVTVLDTQTPFVNAGPDRIVNMDETVHFNASLCTDNVGIVSYTWTFMDEVPIFFSGMLQSYQFNKAGVFVVTLNVTDATGNWATDTMTVTVLDTEAPIADAGPDQFIKMGETVQFNASLSADNVGIVSHTWTFTDGVPITLPGSIQSHWFENAGVFEVTLNVSDAVGKWAVDSMTVTVWDSEPPIAIAGKDLVIDEGQKITFDAGSSSDNVGIINYSWEFPLWNSYHDLITIKLYGSKVEYQFNDPGLFTIRLAIYDAAYNLATTTVNVTVKDITSPIANPGPDQRVAVGSTVILDGSWSWDNVGIVRYSWKFIYDGSERTVDESGFEFVFDKAGSYEIELTVYDAYDHTGKDVVIITVIDTGLVKGTVLDRKWNPVEGASVELKASDGKIYSTTTLTNGSFSLEIFYGGFTWTITKRGYSTISGTGSVDAMGTTEIVLSGTPLIKEETKGPSIILFIVLAVILMLIIIGIAIFLLTRKKKEEPSVEGKEKTEDLPVDEKEVAPSPEVSILSEAQELTTPPLAVKENEPEKDPDLVVEYSESIEDPSKDFYPDKENREGEGT